MFTRSLSLLFLIAALLLCSVPRAYAQAPPSTVILTDANKLQWTPSPDDGGTFGTPPVPLVTSYRADIYLKSAVTISGTTFTPTGAPIVTVDYGKPTTDGNGNQTAPVTLKTSVTPNIEYVAFMRAVGSGGVSVLSNGVGPFGFPGPPRPPANLRITP